MEIASWLTDVFGARLTGSPSAKAAGDWTVKKLNEWGMANAKMETWGPFGRGWSNERMVAQVVSPRPFPIIGYPAAWTPGTNGAVKAEVAVMKVDSVPDLERVPRQAARQDRLHAAATRLGPATFHGRRIAVSPTRRSPSSPTRRSHPTCRAAAGLTRAPTIRRPAASAPQQEFQRALASFLVDEGVVAVVTPGRGDDGTVFTGASGSRDAANPTKVPGLIFSTEHYGRIARMVEKGIPVTVELDVKNTFYDDDPSSFNIVAEIPGHRPEAEGRSRHARRPFRLVAHRHRRDGQRCRIRGHAGSASTDQGRRGCRPRRTIRIGLWTGEEEGLLGSRAYVKEHFGDPQTHAAQTAGAESVRWLLQRRQRDRARFAACTCRRTRRSHRSSNHGWRRSTIRACIRSPRTTPAARTICSFDAVGLPGFQFIQDPVDYGSRTHHSNMDVYERLVPGDMKHNAAVVAAFVYLTANRDEKLPRKAMPTVQ